MAGQQQARPGSAISKVAPEYITNRQGKDFVAFVGLLEEGTKRGIKRMVSQLVQAPTDQNGHLAIMQGTVEFDDGRVFSSIGDASPENVGRMIAMHCVRMAETRAFARALRHGLNIGGTALEELGGEEEEDRRGGQHRTEHAAPARLPADDGHMPAPPHWIPDLRRMATLEAERLVRPLRDVPDTLTRAAARTLKAEMDASLAAVAGEAPASVPPGQPSGGATQQQIDRLRKLQTAVGRTTAIPQGLTSDQAATMILELVAAFNAQSRGGRQQTNTPVAAAASTEDDDPF